MQNRTRNKQLIVRVTEQEHELIKQRISRTRIKNFNTYARKMLIGGYIIEVDLKQYHELATEVNKIGVNINQIAKVVNETKSVSPQQIDEIQGEVDKVWQLLKLSLSTLQSRSR